MSRLGARRSHRRHQLQRRQRIALARAGVPVEGQEHRQRVLDQAAREEVADDGERQRVGHRQ
eukprot:1136109-Pyramimonas_sp.AAC.1